VAIIAEETGVVVMTLHMIRGEVQAIAHVLPSGYQRPDIVVHGHVWVTVDLPPHQTQVPPTGIARIAEIPEFEGLWGSNDEEITYSRVVVYIPESGSREENSIVPPTTCVVVLLRGRGEHHPGRAVGVDVENRHKGAFGDSVVDPRSFAPLKHRFRSPIQPNPGFQVVYFIVLNTVVLAGSGGGDRA
jgi:hypothetical protein